MGEFVECHKVVSQVLDKIEVRCNGDQCHLKGELIPYSKLTSDHACKLIGCPFECDKKPNEDVGEDNPELEERLLFQNKKEADKHFEVCSKVKVRCQLCDEIYKRKEIKDH